MDVKKYPKIQTEFSCSREYVLSEIFYSRDRTARRKIVIGQLEQDSQDRMALAEQPLTG